MIEDIAKEFNINYKINTISFDNASNNNVAIKILKRNIRPILNGDLFHCRCCRHILNLIVQECIDCIRFYIESKYQLFYLFKHQLKDIKNLNIYV